MKPIGFKEARCVYAKDQPEYLPLPAFKSEDGRVISCWKFSWWERLKVLFGSKMWFHMLTFNKPLQPQRPTLDCPFGRKKSYTAERIFVTVIAGLCGGLTLVDIYIGEYGWACSQGACFVLMVVASFMARRQRKINEQKVTV